MTAAQMLTLDQASSKHWDVIIIGAGMGGGTAAYGLAKAGHKVLLIEKGLRQFHQPPSGIDAEQTDPRARLENGQWPEQLQTEVDGTRACIWPPLGCGLGGSSLLYAAALQRLEPMDFAPQSHPQGSEIRWPFSYNTLEPYYRQAEDLFSVAGSQDPLTETFGTQLVEPPPMCERDNDYFQVFQAAGLHPYRLHVAIKYQPGCTECGGYRCVKQCKGDAFNRCILPALESGNLFIVDQSEVHSITANATHASHVCVKHAQQEFSIHADIIVLSAGAYMSPAVLLRSKNHFWPHGLANESDMVGRNLMFHASDFIALWPRKKWPRKKLSRQGPNKTIAVRDFYTWKGKKYGEFQSTGLCADFGLVLYGLRLLFDQSALRHFQVLRHLLRIPAYLAAKFYGEASIFTTIVEDFPYPENRIVVDKNAPSGIRLSYRIHDEFRQRVTHLNRALRKQLSALRSLSMNAGVSLNFGHPCGTCKAGHEADTSVVDKDCKAHGIDNLYIVDSSFMPSSGGTNPSLTIAANALRVADIISAKLKAAAAQQ